jgi:uncharacterized protein YbaR (Trm112 family)
MHRGLIMELKIADLLKTRVCPCCNGKLKIVRKWGAFNLASKKMLECKTCHSNF